MALGYSSSVGTPPVCTSLAFLLWRQQILEYFVNYVSGARGITYYIDNGRADNSGNGLTPATAKKTLAAAQTILTANNSSPASSGIAILFARGSVWNTGTTLSSTAPHVTLGAYGTGAKPLLSAFTTTFTGASWTSSGGIYYQNIAGDVSRFRDQNDVSAPWTKVDTLARCQALARSYFYDPTGNSGTGRLWANFPVLSQDPSHHPTTEVALTNTVSAIGASGDDTLVDGIRFDGYGTSRVFTGTQGYAVQVGTGGTDLVVVRDCEGYHTGWHGMGHFATGAGMSAWIGNTTGLMDNDGLGNCTNYVGYSGSGGHEVAFFNNTCWMGGAPEMIGTFDGRYGFGSPILAHTTTGLVNLLVEDGTVILDGQYQTSQPSGNNNPIVWSDLINCRSFRSNQDYRAAQIPNPPTCVQFPLANPTVGKADSGGTVLTGSYGVLITYLRDSSESVNGGQSTVTTVTNLSTITITSPPAFPGITGWRAYVGAVGGPWRLQGTTNAIGTNLTLTSPPSAVTATQPTNSGRQTFVQGNTSDPYTANLCCKMPKYFKAFDAFSYINTGNAGAGFFYRCRYDLTVPMGVAGPYNIGIVGELGTSRWYNSELSIYAPEGAQGYGFIFGTANFGGSGGTQAAVVKNSRVAIEAGGQVTASLGVTNTAGNLSNNAYFGVTAPSADLSPVTGAIGGPKNATRGAVLYGTGTAAIEGGYVGEYDFNGRPVYSRDVGTIESSSATASPAAVLAAQSAQLTALVTGVNVTSFAAALKDGSALLKVSACAINGSAWTATQIGPTLLALASGTAQAGTVNTLTLDASDTSPAGAYVGQSVMLSKNTGAGQTALVTAHAAGKITVLTTYPGGNWIVTPNNTTQYVIPGLNPSVTNSVTITSPSVNLTPG